MRLLLINANTTQAVTDLCAVAAHAVASPTTEIVPLTGRFGSRIIESRPEIAIAAHALLDVLSDHAEGADAALIAVSYDSGLEAARDLVTIPVLGMTQAALIAATVLGSRIGMVTFGTPWIYRELAARYGMADRIADIAVVETNPQSAYSDPAGIVDTVATTAQRLVSERHADVVLLCGAALAGMSARLAGRVDVPVLDGITAGIPMCEALARLPRRHRQDRAGRKDSVGLGPALAGLLRPG